MQYLGPSAPRQASGAGSRSSRAGCRCCVRRVCRGGLRGRRSRRRGRHRGLAVAAENSTTLSASTQRGSATHRAAAGGHQEDLDAVHDGQLVVGDDRVLDAAAGTSDDQLQATPVDAVCVLASVFGGGLRAGVTVVRAGPKAEGFVDPLAEVAWAGWPCGSRVLLRCTTPGRATSDLRAVGGRPQTGGRRHLVPVGGLGVAQVKPEAGPPVACRLLPDPAMPHRLSLTSQPPGLAGSLNTPAGGALLPAIVTRRGRPGNPPGDEAGPAHPGPAVAPRNPTEAACSPTVFPT